MWFPCETTSVAASSAPNPCSWYFVFRLRRLVLWECDWANPWFRLLYRDGGWLPVRVVRLHYYPAVRSYLSWLIYQLVILFKIIRRKDRDNIRIKNETWLNESERSRAGGNVSAVTPCSMAWLVTESCHTVWRDSVRNILVFSNTTVYMSRATSCDVTQILVTPRTLVRPKGLVLGILV
jgi:hypothetical protein